MANDNQDALTTGALFFGGGIAGYTAGRWIVARWLDSKGAPRTAPPAPAASSPAALPPATSSPPSAPTAPALPPPPPPAPRKPPSSSVASGPVTSPSQVSDDDSSSDRPVKYPPAVERWRPLVTELANGIDVDFLLTWIQHESGGNPCATGIPNKETGLFQSYHPYDDRHGATFEELRKACDPGKQTAHRPLTAAEQRIQVSTGIALVRACMDVATRTLYSIGARWSARDHYCLAKLWHALPAAVYRFPLVYAVKHKRPPSSWAELRTWVRSLSDEAVIEMAPAVRPWASLAQRDRLFDNAERVGNAVSQGHAHRVATADIRRRSASSGLAWSASRMPRGFSVASRRERLPDTPLYRGASWWSIKTPGVILDEMNAAKNEVESLGRDIYATYRHPFDAQHTAAVERFVKTYGRKPGVGREAQDTDYQIVHSWMRPVPTADDLRQLSYQGQFVHQWGEFEREFANFWSAHADSWTDRMWRGTYDKAVEYRKRTAAWRKRFEEIGGKPTTPAPQAPTEEFFPPGVSISWKPFAVIGGIAAGALIIPAAIRASRRD